MQPVTYFVLAFVIITIVCDSIEIPCLENSKSEVTVNTTTGMLQGKAVCLSNTEKVIAFLGIPYAEPPIKDLRFMVIPRTFTTNITDTEEAERSRIYIISACAAVTAHRSSPPVKKAPWNDTMEALHFGKVCLHPPPERMPDVCDRVWTRLPYAYGISDESEDCLTLNIFTPNLTGSYPVLFFVHGGSYRVGAGGLHPAERLSHSGAVVVTFNYRLGIFGFLSTGDSAAPGNYGLMDQIMALEWVKENIQQFGGNPRNITMVGQSAGASAVHLHLLSNRTKDLFSAAIIMSGVALSPWAVERTPIRQARYVGTEAIVLYSLDNTTSQQESNMFTAQWAPVVDHDLISDEPDNLMRQGQIQNKPLIIGMTDDEGSVFVHGLLRMIAGREAFHVMKHTDYINRTVVRQMLEAVRYNDSRAVEAALKFFYFDSPVEKSVDTIWENYAQMLNDAIFTVDIVKALNYHSQHRIPTYFYVFDYRSQNDSLPAWTGVYHGMDMKYIFGCPFAPETEAVHERDQIISDLMMKFWINFGQFGNPINSGDVTRNIEWSPYGYNNGQYYLNISGGLPRRQQHYRREQMIFWNSYMPVVATIDTERSAVHCRTSEETLLSVIEKLIEM